MYIRWRAGQRARMCESTAGTNCFFIFIHTFSSLHPTFFLHILCSTSHVSWDRDLPETAVPLKVTVINPKQGALPSSAAVTWRPQQSELSGQLARTCKIKRRHILTFRGLFTPLPSERGAKAPSCPLISSTFVSNLSKDEYLALITSTKPIGMQKCHSRMNTEHCWTSLIQEEFLLTPPCDPDFFG